MTFQEGRKGKNTWRNRKYSKSLMTFSCYINCQTRRKKRSEKALKTLKQFPFLLTYKQKQLLQEEFILHPLHVYIWCQKSLEINKNLPVLYKYISSRENGSNWYLSRVEVLTTKQLYVFQAFKEKGGTIIHPCWESLDKQEIWLLPL